MINLSIDVDGPIKAVELLQDRLFGLQQMGAILQRAAVLWIRPISERLKKSTATSGYEFQLDKTMCDLDEQFALMLGGGDWAHKTDAERRIPGGYNKGQITGGIASKLNPSQPFHEDGYIAVGIGNIEELNAVAGLIGKNQKVQMWRILNFGTGEYNPESGKPVVRYGKQVFFSSTIQKGILKNVTVNPGFKGREYFVQLDGDIHHADYNVRDFVLDYMIKKVRELSYGGK